MTYIVKPSDIGRSGIFNCDIGYEFASRAAWKAACDVYYKMSVHEYLVKNYPYINWDKQKNSGIVFRGIYAWNWQYAEMFRNKIECEFIYGAIESWIESDSSTSELTSRSTRR